MRYTNRLNLPQSICDAIVRSTYTKGDADASITELVAPARQKALTLKHKDELTADYADQLWKLWGSISHELLERVNTSGTAEERLYAEIGGWRISGSPDLVYENGRLDEWKTGSAWAYLDGATPIEYVRQVNGYALLMRKNGKPVTELNIWAMLRDYSDAMALRNNGYPRDKFVRRSVPVWSEAEATEYYEARVAAHKAARAGDLPLCTDEERWAEPPTFAVMKRGRVSAVKLHETEEAANLHAATDKDLSVVKRDGVNKRCEKYCDAAPFCSQWQSIKGKSE